MLILAYLNISKIIKSSFSGPHSTLIKETHAVIELARVFCWGFTERFTVFGIFLQILDLTYACYKISEERGKVKGDMTTLNI
jgi:hypothetical protein